MPFGQTSRVEAHKRSVLRFDRVSKPRLLLLYIAFGFVFGVRVYKLSVSAGPLRWGTCFKEAVKQHEEFINAICTTTQFGGPTKPYKKADDWCPPLSDREQGLKTVFPWTLQFKLLQPDFAAVLSYKPDLYMVSDLKLRLALAEEPREDTAPRMT